MRALALGAALLLTGTLLHLANPPAHPSAPDVQASEVRLRMTASDGLAVRLEGLPDAPTESLTPEWMRLLPDGRFQARNVGATAVKVEVHVTGEGAGVLACISSTASPSVSCFSRRSGPLRLAPGESAFVHLGTPAAGRSFVDVLVAPA